MVEEKKCPNCNANLAENSSLCKMCGVDINTSQKTNSIMLGNPIKFRKISNLLLIMILIMVAICVALSFTNVSEEIKNISGIIPGIIMGCIILYISYIAFVIGCKMKKLYETGKNTKGKIVGYKAEKTSLSKINMPIIEFEVDGNKYRTISNIGNNIQSEIGDEIDIVYNNENPYDSVALNALQKYKTIKTIGIIGFIVSVLFVIYSIFF